MNKRKVPQHTSGPPKITKLLNKDPKTLLILNTEVNVSYTYTE